MTADPTMYREEAETLYRQLVNEVSALSDTPASTPELLTKIEKDFAAANDLIKELDDIHVMTGNSDFDQLSNRLKRDVPPLERRYIDEKKRCELLAGNKGRTRAGDRAALLNQRETIREGEEILRNAGSQMRQTTAMGERILEDLHAQAEVEGHIERNMQLLDGKVDEGDKKMNRIICRERKTTIIVWIVVGIAVVAMCVFLGFVFI